MIRYTIAIAAFGIPGTLVGFLLLMFFSHQGGPLLYATMAFVPGIWLCSFISKDLGPLSWACIASLQLGYYFILAHLFLLWREYRAVGT